MANAFAKAAAKPAAASKSKKPQTLWLAPPELDGAISALIEFQGQRKAIETKEEVHKDRLKAAAEDRYLEDYAMHGVPPESPMLLANAAGQTVTYIVQDRATGHDIKDDTYDALVQILGQDGADANIHHQTIYGFDAVVMGQTVRDGSGREVQEVLGERLMGLLEDMRHEGLLCPDQVDHLLTAKQIRTYKPATTSRLVEICGRNVPLMKRLLAAMGSAVVRYIKP